MFKVFKNEFNRLIKMPLMYLMIIVLLLVTFLSLVFYSPVKKANTHLDFEGASSNEIYSTFILNSDYKNAYDIQIYQAETMFNYYSKIQNRIENTALSLESILVSFDSLKAEIPKGDSELLYNKYQKLLQDIMQFKLVLINFSELDEIDYINFIANSQEYQNNLQDLNTLIESANYYDANLANKTEAANALVNFFEANLFEEKLFNLNDLSWNFLSVTLTEITEEINLNYNKYTEYLKISEAYFDSNYANLWRVSLLNKISRFSEFFYSIVNSPYFSIYVKNDLVQSLDASILQAQMSINLIGAQVDNYSAHQLAVKNIRESNFINYLKQFSNGYELVKPSNQVIQDLQPLISNHLQENKNTVYSNIVNLQNNSDPNLIINEIEKYQELSSIAYQLVLYSIIIDTHDDIIHFNINDSYGKELANFNEYEYKSTVTLYVHFITHNEYSSDYSMPNQFNTVQESPSTIDYAFFSLKISAIVIAVILAIIATIVYPNDTKKGTINLLLTRPLSRTQIFFGKYLASLLVGVFLFIISFAFVLSYAVFAEFNYFSSVIISVFNSNTIIKILPIHLLLIYCFSIILELAFILAIIFLIAVSFKRSRLSFFVSIFVLSIFYLFNLVTTSSVVFAFFPHTNINFYKYFLINSNFESKNLIYKLLHSPVITNMNIWLSLMVYLTYISILFVISNAILKSRDY